MFITYLFIMAKIRKRPKCPSKGKWIKKIWYIHTVECYSAVRKKEILQYATTWIKLEDSMLIEISQSQKDKY